MNYGPGYIYTNGQTFYSNQYGFARILYRLWADPIRYPDVERWGARVKDPDGNWSDWSSTMLGEFNCTKAGTWEIEGRVYVNWDSYGGGHYWMYTSRPLYFYVVDNAAPTAPKNLTVSPSANNHPFLRWDNNNELDLQKYEIYKFIISEWGWQYLGISAVNSFEDVSEITQISYPYHNIQYKIRAVDINSNKSDYSNAVSISVQGLPLEKQWIFNSSLPVPNDFLLHQNYPNPFNFSTVINYAIPIAANVKMKIYDLLGREVAEIVNEFKEAGYYKIDFNGENLSSGIYIYRIISIIGEKILFSESKRMVLIK